MAQRLLFSFTLPLSAVASGALPKERSPKVFPITFTVIFAGVILGSSRDEVMAMLIHPTTSGLALSGAVSVCWLSLLAEC